MICVNVSKRYSVDEVLNHPWFKNCSKDAIKQTALGVNKISYRVVIAVEDAKVNTDVGVINLRQRSCAEVDVVTEKVVRRTVAADCFEVSARFNG